MSIENSIDLYNIMQKSGAFDPGSNNYIWIRDMEWIDPKQIEKNKEKVPENVIPIAVTGAGDVWGINNNKIVLYYHDDEEELHYADNLKNAIFRAIVEYLSDNDFIAESENDENNAVCAAMYVKKYTDVFSSYFSEEQVNDLQEIIKNNINEFHYNNGSVYHSFISVEEADKIIGKYINVDDVDSTEDINIQASNERVVFSDCFSDEMVERLRCHCKENVEYYLNLGNKLSQSIPENSSLQQIIYKNRTNDLFLYRIGEILTDGSFYTGVKKKQGIEVKGDVTEYYIDENGKPIYAKLYADGNMNPHYGMCFYFVSDNSVISVKYSFNKEKNEYKYCETIENTFDSSGKILSFIKYDESYVHAAEYNLYAKGILTESRYMKYFYLNEKIGMIPDSYSISGFIGNPSIFGKNIFNYKNDAIVSVHKIQCDSDCCKCFDYNVTDKLYKQILKKKTDLNNIPLM